MVLTFDPFLTQMFPASTGVRVSQAMPMDLYRSGDHYVIHCELPGVDPGSVDVSVEGSVLTIRAERSARTDEGVQWLRRERRTGAVERRLTLGDGLDLDKIAATFQDGILTLTIPVAEAAKPRRIQITSATDARPLNGAVGQRELERSRS